MCFATFLCLGWDQHGPTRFPGGSCRLRAAAFASLFTTVVFIWGVPCQPQLYNIILVVTQFRGGVKLKGDRSWVLLPFLISRVREPSHRTQAELCANMIAIIRHLFRQDTGREARRCITNSKRNPNTICACMKKFQGLEEALKKLLIPSSIYYVFKYLLLVALTVVAYPHAADLRRVVL